MMAAGVDRSLAPYKRNEWVRHCCRFCRETWVVSIKRCGKAVAPPLKTPEPAGPRAAAFRRRLDSGLLDVGYGPFEFAGVLGADGDQSGGAEYAVAGGEVGFLLEHVVVLGGLLGVLDLTDPLPLSGVGDVLGLLLSDVAGGLVGAHGRVEQCERPSYAGGEQDGREEAGVDE